jgi:hypothetical protein
MTPPYEFKALGWIWELAPEKGPPVMVCAADKFAFVCRQLKKWFTAKRLSIRALESLVGILRWLSSGFRIGLSHLPGSPRVHCGGGGKAQRQSDTDTCTPFAPAYI